MPLYNPTSAGRFNVGPFKSSNIPAGATTPLGRYGSAALDFFWVSPRAGNVTALSVDMQGAVTAGSFTFQVSVDGVAATGVDSVLVVTNVAPTQFKARVLPVPVAVLAGQRVAARVVTDAGALPLTLDPVFDFEFTPN